MPLSRHKGQEVTLDGCQYRPLIALVFSFIFRISSCNVHKVRFPSELLECGNRIIGQIPKWIYMLQLLKNNSYLIRCCEPGWVTRRMVSGLIGALTDRLGYL